MATEKPDNKLPLRVPLIIHAYLADLADWGTYGKGKQGVTVRFIGDGIKAAIDRGDIDRRSARDFPDWKEGDDS